MMRDLQAIRLANPLPSIIGAHVKLRRNGAEWLGCCPFHPDKTPSLTIFADAMRFHCFGCGASGDVFDYVARAHGVGFAEAAQMLHKGWVTQAPRWSNPPPAVEKDDRTAEALAIWAQAVSIDDTPAEAYLTFRGIEPPYPRDFRFTRLPYGKSKPIPCLVAAVRDIRGEITGIQRIFIREDGQGKADVPKPKLSLGKVAGGAIRIGELNDGATCLTVCEGPEDGLSLWKMGRSPVWVAVGASMLPGMKLPTWEHLGQPLIVIARDNDLAGRNAAEKASSAFLAQGYSVRTIAPLPEFKDFNDEWRARDNADRV
jgi:DNA primase